MLTFTHAIGPGVRIRFSEKPNQRIRDMLKANGFRLFRGGRVLAQCHAYFFDARIPQVERMGMALTAIADDRDFSALNEIDIGVGIVINAHNLTFSPSLASLVAASIGMF